MSELIILNKISRLDLSTQPVEEIKNYIAKLGPTAGIGYTLHPGFPIFRARPNESDEEVFTTRSQLSYKPQIFNTSFQRASTPNKTMFYGSILPPEIGEDDINNARLTACLEASKTFRNNLFNSNEKITFSRWEVKSDINLLIILPGFSNDKQDSFLNRMNSELNKILITDRILSIRTKLINEFFAQQFANPNIRFDTDYIISALFAESKLEYGFDGIIYPSVKAKGRGYNICITPDCVDKNLQLTAAGEGRIIKVGYTSEVLNERQTQIFDDSKPFNFELVGDYIKPVEVIKRLENEYR
jgi:hypothetical protein